MRSLLHTTLVVLTLLSQFVGGVAVLCVESDGGLLVEFRLGGEDCCDTDDDGSAPAASVTPEPSDCGTCQDLSLTDRHRVERDADDLDRALGEATTLVAIGFPCAPTPTPMAAPRSPRETVRADGSPGVRAQVAETIVLTC